MLNVNVDSEFFSAYENEEPVPDPEEEKRIRLAAAGYRVRKRRKRREPVRLKTVRDRTIQAALDSVGGHRGKAAKLLGIGKRTLYRWLAGRRMPERQ